jgi:hypothetical protein
VFSLTLRGQELGVSFARLTTSAQLDYLIVWAANEGYATVALDHAGGLQSILIKEVGGYADVPIVRNWGMLRQEQWGVVNQQTNERLAKLFALADLYQTNVVVIAHERDFTNTNVSAEILQPHVGSALTPGSKEFLDGAADNIGQTFIRKKEMWQEVSVAGGPPEKIKVPTGETEYCLRVGRNPVYQTGFRVPPDVDLPDAIVDPNWSKIAAILG